MEMPRWLLQKGLEDQALARQRFLLRFFALHATEKGDLASLSEVLGFGRTMLAAYVWKEAKLLPVEHAIRMEEVLGRNLCPRELIRPDIFRVNDKTEAS